MSLKSYIIFAILGYLCITWTCSAETLTFEVPNRDKFCFNEIFDKAKKWTFEYEVIRGGDYDIDIRVKGPGGAILYDKDRSQEGKFNFDAQIGEYEVCFSNEFSTFEHKVVYFTLEPYILQSLAEDAGGCLLFMFTYIPKITMWT